MHKNLTMKKSICFFFFFITFVSNAQLKIKYEFVDNFNDNKHNWLLYEKEDRSCKIKNNNLYFNNKTEISKWSFVETNINLSKDFIIETSIKLISGTNNNLLSLIINKGKNDNDEFGFADNGYWLYKKRIAKKILEETGWQKTKYVEAGEFNKLTILKLDEKVFFLVNNKPVLLKHHMDFSFKGMAINVCPKSKVVVDYFKVGYFKANSSEKNTYASQLFSELEIATSENKNVIIENNLLKDLYTSFDENEFGFGLNESESHSFTIKDSSLDLVTSSKSFYQTWAKEKINQNYDFDLSTSFKKVSGTNNKAISLLINKGKNILEFAYAPNGYWFCSIKSDKKTIVNTRWQKTNLIHNSANNSLRIKKIGNHLYFILNDKVLTKYQNIETGNTIYIKVPDSIHVKVDDLKLTQTYRSIKEQQKLISSFDKLWDKAKKEKVGALGKTKEQIIENEKLLEKARKKERKVIKKYNDMFKGAPLSEVIKKLGQPYKSTSYSISYRYRDYYNGKQRDLIFFYINYNNGKVKYKRVDYANIIFKI